MDTDAIIHERCNKLAGFVLTLLAVYVELDVLLGDQSAKGSSDLRAFLIDIEGFLGIPPRWKEVKDQLVRAGLPPFELERVGGRDVVVQLRCGHISHDNCILQWLQSKTTCPICLLLYSAEFLHIFCT